MKCPNCNKEISDGFKFCPYCATPIVANKCPHCGSTNLPADSRFCPDCGEPLIKKNDDNEIFGDSSILLSKLFPVWGITLGKTSMYEMQEENEFHTKLEKFEGTPMIHAKNEKGEKGASIWCENKADCFNQIYITRTHDLPEKWIALGFDWSLSYNSWLHLLSKLGFTIHNTIASTQYFQGRTCLDAEFEAKSIDDYLIFKFDFNYGNYNGEGHTTISKNSLYSIDLRINDK